MRKTYPWVVLFLAATNASALGCGTGVDCRESRTLSDHERVIYERAERVMGIEAPEPEIAFLPVVPCGDGWCLEKYPKAGGAYSRECEAIFAPGEPAPREQRDWIVFVEAGHHLLYEIGVPRKEQHCHEKYKRLDGGHSCRELGEGQAL